jgi:hypothetical protein
VAAGSAEEGSFCGVILWIPNCGFKNPANLVLDGAAVFGGKAFQSCDHVFSQVRNGECVIFHAWLDRSPVAIIDEDENRLIDICDNISEQQVDYAC